MWGHKKQHPATQNYRQDAQQDSKQKQDRAQGTNLKKNSE
jgi:hypothetical protein